MHTHIYMYIYVYKSNKTTQRYFDMCAIQTQRPCGPAFLDLNSAWISSLLDFIRHTDIIKPQRYTRSFTSFQLVNIFAQFLSVSIAELFNCAAQHKERETRKCVPGSCSLSTPATDLQLRCSQWEATATAVSEKYGKYICSTANGE